MVRPFAEMRGLSKVFCAFLEGSPVGVDPQIMWIQVPTLCMSVPCTCSAATDFKSTISSVKSSQRFAACLGITLGGLGLITQVISRKGLYKDRHGIRRYACYLQHIWRRW